MEIDSHAQKNIRDMPQEERMEVGGAEALKLLDNCTLLARNLGGGKLSLILENDRGKKLDLASIAGSRFIIAEKAGFNWVTGKINVSMRELQRDPRHFVGIIHEIGHAIISDRRGILGWPVMVALGVHTARINRLSRKTSLRTAKRIFDEEQAAWIEALKILKKFRNDGFDLFPLFQNMDDFGQYVSASIGGVRNVYERKKNRRVS